MFAGKSGIDHLRIKNDGECSSDPLVVLQAEEIRDAGLSSVLQNFYSVAAEFLGNPLAVQQLARRIETGSLRDQRAAQDNKGYERKRTI